MITPQQMFDATLRVEEILHIGTMAADDSLPSRLKDFLEEIEEEDLKIMFPDISKWVVDEIGTREFSDAFREWAIQKNKYGFIVQFATPVKKWSKDKKSASYSWGYYNTKWLYADTFETALESGMKWAEETRAEEKAQPHK